MPLAPETSDAFDELIRALHQRLEQGEKLYGTIALRRPVDALIREIEEEILDVCGWSVMLWAKLRRLRAAAANRLDD